jgi:DNA modification methylase
MRTKTEREHREGSMSKIEWRNRIVKTGTADPAELLPHPENWREHPGAQQRKMSGALDELGWVAPVLVNRTSGRIIDGHMRAALAIQRGEKQVPVAWVELTDDEERLALATIDPLGDLARQGDEALRGLISGIKVSDSDLAEMLASLAVDAGGDQESSETTREAPTAAERVAELQKKWDTRAGDVWTIGKHRIGCLDATDPKAMKRLMAGKKSRLVFTDPPYGVAYQAEGHDAIRADALTGDALVDFLLASLRNAVEHTADDAAWYIWHATASRDEFTIAMRKAGLLEKQYLIWAKPQPTLGHSDYQQAHEPCFYATKQGHQPRWFGARDKATVWVIAQADHSRAAAALTNGIVVSSGERKIYIATQAPKGKKIRTFRIEEGERLELYEPGRETDTWYVGRDTTRPFHPTQKPIELAARALRNSSEPGDIVLDPFLGSGSTAVAAERGGRICYGTDYNPGYVAVILERHADEGLKATVERA